MSNLGFSKNNIEILYRTLFYLLNLIKLSNGVLQMYYYKHYTFSRDLKLNLN